MDTNIQQAQLALNRTETRRSVLRVRESSERARSFVQSGCRTELSTPDRQSGIGLSSRQTPGRLLGPNVLTIRDSPNGLGETIRVTT